MISSFKNLLGEIVALCECLKVLWWNLFEECFLIKVKFKLHIIFSVSVNEMVTGIEVSCNKVVAVRAALNGEFVKNWFIFIQFTQFTLQRFKYWYYSHWFAGLIDIPHLDRQEISREYVSSVLGKCGFTDWADDICEEIFFGWVFFFLQDLSCIVTDSTLSHICNLDNALARWVYEDIIMLGMELRGSNDFIEFFDVVRLQVTGYEGLVRLV